MFNITASMNLTATHFKIFAKVWFVK